jgi:hypothetical protein
MKELTAAGTVQDLHLIPFSSVKPGWVPEPIPAAKVNDFVLNDQLVNNSLKNHGV